MNLGRDKQRRSLERTCFDGYSWRNDQKLPIGYQEFAHYPVANPILITLESVCFKTIRRLNGVCLLCSSPLTNIDISCCFQREAWVLYSQPRQLLAAMRLAQAIQQSGAAEIILIHLGSSTPSSGQEV